MNWCNCNHDDYYDLMSVNDYGVDSQMTCYTCGHRVNDAELISLLVKEVKKLSQIVEDLEREGNLNDPSDLNFAYEQIQEKIREFRSIEENMRTYAVNIEKVKVLEKENKTLKSVTKDLDSRVINLEFKNKQMIDVISKLEHEQKERVRIEIEEEQKKIAEDKYFFENVDKQTERFDMMDL
jgi:hypothetical protein